MRDAYSCEEETCRKRPREKPGCVKTHDLFMGLSSFYRKLRPIKQKIQETTGIAVTTPEFGETYELNNELANMTRSEQIKQKYTTITKI